ncbi:MAG TPA: molybdenum cofactor guanylyltransferase [Victivallales bacterium]|nr:molybdenum cofactor guanylyltransferase [Victivallales bacterium]
MIKKDNIALIGAADRNVGKTEFACSLINRYSNSRKVVAVKVTTVKESNGKCPRGGDGCGVCSSLLGEYSITEETDAESKKDTSRMLRAGADKVYWLRVLSTGLMNGFKELLAKIHKENGTDLCIVCESNSLRKVLKPGIFLVLNRAGNEKIKPSCKEVMHYADKFINLISVEKGFDADLEDFSFINKSWYIKKNAAVIILAGGNSSRMGSDKSQLLVSKKTMVKHIIDQVKPYFKQIIIGANDVAKFQDLNCKIVPDKTEGYGPLMGILSCLESSDYNVNFLLACDIPDINMEFVDKMFLEVNKEYDAVVPKSSENFIEPLFAIYKKSIISTIEDILFKLNKKRISLIFDNINTKYIDFENCDWYHNINTKEDYHNFISR